MSVEILPYQYRSPLLQEAVRVYTIVWGRDKEESLAFFRRHTQLPEFYGIVAKFNHQVIGMAFGTASLPGQWWHDKVAEQLGNFHPALQEAWVLTELAVVPKYQNRKIGGILHDHLLNMQPCPNILLSTQVNNYGARRFYERRGWGYLHKGFAFNRGHQPYVIMHKSLPS